MLYINKKVNAGVSGVAQWVNDPAFLFGGASLIPGWVQGVKDPVLLQLHCRSQLQLRFYPWPGNLHMPWVWGEKKEKIKCTHISCFYKALHLINTAPWKEMVNQYFFFLSFFFVFLGPHPWHTEGPRLGVESEL